MDTPRAFGCVLPVSLYATTPAPPIDYLFRDLAFVAGTTGVEHGAGGSGKSMLTLEMCIALALAGEIADWLGIAPVPRTGGKPWRVLYYTTEDPDAVIHHRIREIVQLWKLTDAQRDALAARVLVVSLFGATSPMRVTDETAVAQVLADAGGEARLIVFDTLTRFHAEDENDNTAMAAVIGKFDHIAAATGAGVLVLHHDSKAAVLAGLGSKQQSARGANAITENSRWALGLAGTDVPGVLVATQSKHNYGQESEHFFTFTGRGVLSPTSPPASLPAKGKGRKNWSRGGGNGIY